MLAEFDQIFLGVQHPVGEVGRIVGWPCSYLPLAVDVLRFSPLPKPPPRSIDVCNIGRRSPVTHEALLRLARDRRIFYYYDTVRASGERGRQMNFPVGNPRQDRLPLRSLPPASPPLVADPAPVVRL